VIESALRTHILGDTSIKGQISERLYPLTLPQDPTLPAMTYQKISGFRFHDMEGASGLASPRFQFDIWSKSYLTSKNISDLLRKRLDGFRGTIGSDVIQGAFLDSERDFFEEDELLKFYRVSMDFFIYHEEIT
jgi:hypothetical protein